MNDSKTLQIPLESLFEELPKELSCSVKYINVSNITGPHSFCDPNKPLPEKATLEPFIPIIVQSNDNDNYTIIDGYKRYLSFYNRPGKTITCMCIQTPLSEFAAGLLRIAFNSSRPGPLQEKCCILQWLQNQCREDIFESTAQKAGFSPKETEQVLKLLQCENHIQEAVFNGFLDISVISLFTVLSTDDQHSFQTRFKDYKLSMQTQRELLEWLPEIAYSKDTTVRDILADPHIRNTLKEPAQNAPQKIEQVRAYLYAQKFPRLSKARSTWETLAKTLNPDPSCVTFTPQPYFEKNRLDVSISLTDAQKGQKILTALAAIPQKDWQKLIYPCDDM